MEVIFCDVCNESIPLVDLEQGRAVRRGARAVCAACERAMSAQAAAGEPEVAPTPRPAGMPATMPAVTAPPALAAESAKPRSRALLWLSVIGIATAGFAVQRELNERSAVLERSQRMEESRLSGMQAQLYQAQFTAQSAQTLVNAQHSQLSNAKAELDQLRQQLSELQEAQTRATQERQAQETERVDALRRSFEAQLLERERRIEEMGMRVARAEDGMRELQMRFDVLAQAAQELRETPGPPQPSLPQDAAWHALLPRLKDENPSVRWQTVDELSRTGDPAVLEHVVMALADTDLFVRMRAASALGELKLEAALPAILDAMGDAEPMVREAACQSLKLLTGRDPRFDPSASDAEREKRLRALREALLPGSGTGAGAGAALGNSGKV